MQTPTDERELIDMATAIEMLKTTRPTFYRWLRAGRIKGHKAGRQWRFYRDDIEHFLQGKEPRIELVASPEPLLATLAERLAAVGDQAFLGEPGDEPVAEIVNRMIRLGWRLRASDIHVGALITEPGGEMTGLLRYRVDGVLQPPIAIDRRLLPAIVERWKTMSAANPQESQVPQDARLLVNLPTDDQPARLDIRVCFVPSSHGESLTARILDPGAVSLSLERLGYATADRARLQSALHQPNGLILCSGPVGSGKTTTMYACLNEVTSPEVKVMSAEDPVEYLLPWVTQIPVNAAKGVTFARILRSIMRSDPDVVMVGEIRDVETGITCIQVALTGHLVLTQLHTSTAAGALRRLADMGCEPFLIVQATRLAMCQRLVRRLCRECSRESEPSAEQLRKAEEMAVAGGLDWAGLARAFRVPVGCPACAQNGYRGRIALVEMLPMSNAIGGALMANATAEEMQALAVQEGMTTLAADGIRRAAAGETSLAEVFRVMSRP